MLSYSSNVNYGGKVYDYVHINVMAVMIFHLSNKIILT